MELKKIINNKNFIALTFDDVPNEHTEPILKILKKHQVKATFFQIGKKMQQTPELTRLVVAAGHEVGNHTMTHPSLPELESKASILNEIQGFQTLAAEMTGCTPKAFRAPYVKVDEHVWAVLASWI